jgi:hypothetical protein
MQFNFFIKGMHMNSHERYKTPSWRGNEENTELDAAKGVTASCVAGVLLWIVAIAIWGAAVGAW